MITQLECHRYNSNFSALTELTAQKEETSRHVLKWSILQKWIINDFFSNLHN